MTPGEIDTLGKLLSAVPNFSAAALVLYGGMKRWFVYGWLYDQIKTERDEALAMVRDITQAAHRANMAAETAIKRG